MLANACGGAPVKQQVKVVPPAPAAVLPQPPVPTPDEPEAVAINGSLPAPPPYIDDAALTIVAAKLRFERGEELYQTGFLKRAKDEFDAATDILLGASADFPEDERVR